MWHKFRQNPVFVEEKKTYERDFSRKEKLLEHLPQIIVKEAIWTTSFPKYSDTRYDFETLFADIQVLFYLSLGISTFSAIFNVS